MSSSLSHASRLSRVFLIVTALLAPLVVITSGAGPVSAATDGKGAPDSQPTSMERLTTRLEFPAGHVVLPGEKRPMVAVIHNAGFDAAKDFGVYVKVPQGVSLSTDTKNWECSDVVTESGYRCSYGLDLLGEESTEIDFSINSKKATAPGRDQVQVTPFTTSAKKIEEQTSLFTIIDSGDAVLLPHVQHLIGKKWDSWTDGRVVSSHADEKFAYRIGVKNEGHAVLKRGSKISLVQKIGSKVRLESTKIVAGNGECAAGSRIVSCDLMATEDVKPGAHLATVEVTITPTVETDQLPLGTIVVTDPVSKAKHTSKMNLKSVERPSSVKIEVHHETHSEAGGIAQVYVTLENISKDIPHAGFTVKAKLPKEISFHKAVGKNWSCEEVDRNLVCRYAILLAPGKTSSQVDIFFKISKDAAPSIDGYEIDLVSDHAGARFHLPVLQAVSLQAEAIPSSISTSSDIRSNQIRLDADETVDNGNAVSFKWTQRCTSIEDVKNFSACPSGKPTPKVKIDHVRNPRAHAFLPQVQSKKIFVFEVAATTDSSVVYKTVKVKAIPKSVSSADVQAWSVSTPAWINTALINAQVTISNGLLSNGIFTANATLPASVMSRFSVPKDADFLLTATEVQGKECIVVHAASTKASVDIFSFATANMKADYFDYVIAPTECTYAGDTYNGLGLKIHGKVFGNTLTFTGPVELVPALKVKARATTTNMNVSLAGSSFTFKNVIIDLAVDDGAGTATLSMGGAFNILGLDIDVVGNITVPTGVGGVIMEGMQVSLTRALPQTFKFGEVTLKDMSFTIGIRYTPILVAKSALLFVNGTGTIEFLGTSIKVTQMEFDYSNGKLASLIIRSNINLKLPSIKEAKVDIVYIWTAFIPAKDAKSLPTPETLAVDLSAIFVTDSGFAIGTEKNPAYLKYRSAQCLGINILACSNTSGNCIAMGGQVIVPGILDATVSGYMVTGYPCIPAAIQMGDIPGAEKTILSDVPLPLTPGDWRFDASNVKITLGGFTATGNFTVGKMYGVPYGSIDALIHLTTSDKKNTIYVKGSIDPATGVKLVGSADLEVAGIVTRFNIDAALTKTDQHIAATAALKLGASTFTLSGKFGLVSYQGRMVPTQSFSASIPNLEIDGFKLGSAEVSLAQSPTSASVSAALKVNLGLIKFDGSASFHTVKDGVAITVDATGIMKVSDKWEGDMSFHISNCGNSDCTTSGPLKVSAGGHAVIQGKQFDLGTLDFNAGGHFNEQIHYSDRACDTSGNIGGVQWEGCFSYSITAQVSDTAPYAALDADASLRVRSRTRCTTCSPRRWRGWDNWGTISGGIDIQFDPFKLHLRVGSIKVSFDAS